MTVRVPVVPYDEMHPVERVIAAVRRARVMPEQRPGKSEQSVQSPPDFMDAVTKRFGAMDFDLAADENNTQVDKYFFSEKDDSLAQNWNDIEGKNAWLNPPYSDIKPWVKKCSEVHNKNLNIFVLIPASVGSNYFADYIFGKALVLFLSPRMTFVNHVNPYPKDLLLVIYGQTPGFECWRWK